LLSTPYKTTDIYVFLDKRGEQGEFFCRSFFPKETKDYTIGQTAYTLLFKEKSQEVQESVKFSMTAFLRWRKIE